MGMHVDEAGGHHQACGVYDRRRPGARQEAHFRNAPARDGHIRLEPCRPGAINNQPASDQDIKHVTPPICTGGPDGRRPSEFAVVCCDFAIDQDIVERPGSCTIICDEIISGYASIPRQDLSADPLCTLFSTTISPLIMTSKMPSCILVRIFISSLVRHSLRV